MAAKDFKLKGPNVPRGYKPTIAGREREDLTFTVGSVMSVNEDLQTISVELFDRLGPVFDISLSQPFAGTSSYIAAVPDIGSIVILANQRNFCYPIAYIPNYYSGLSGENIKKFPDNIKGHDKNEFSYRFKKLASGEVALGSSKGAELFLSDVIALEDANDNQILIRSKDDTIISSSLNNYVFSGGVWHNSGIIKRNSLVNPKKEDGYMVSQETLDTGKIISSLKPFNSSGGDSFYSEYLIEVEDIIPETLPENDVLSNFAVQRRPISVLSLGNLVGNSNNTDTYGKLLRVRLFNEFNDDSGDFKFETLVGDEDKSLGMATSLFVPNRRDPESGAFFGIDKEGHFFHHLPYSTGGNLGKGRSMSILARGSKKEIWGKDSSYGNSWDNVLEGGIRWLVGSHNERDDNPYLNRSMDIRTDSTVFFQYGTIDSDVYDFDNDEELVSNLRKYKKIEKVGGHVRNEIEGSRETTITGSDRFILGSREESIEGSSSVMVGTGHNLTVGDSFNEKVTKEKQESFGSRKTTIVSGDNELVINVPKGGISEEILGVGDRSVRLTTGSIDESVITRGGRKFRTTSGDYEVDLIQGNIIEKTKAGNVTIETLTGSIDLKGLQTINIKTLPASNINITGGTINMTGKTQILGGVITDKTHMDYTTGAFLKGSMSVKATL